MRLLGSSGDWCCCGGGDDGIERRPIRNSKRKVIEADCAFVEPIGRAVLVDYQSDGEKAWVVHTPGLEPWPFRW
jgi:hypothetical protein